MEATLIDAWTRMGVAVLLGGVIGINRELHHKPAGLRTHALVSLGAALIMTVTGAMGGNDPQAESRAVQGIITGIGFLGAGVILHPSGAGSVRGLTTAATVWIAAGLGTACGAGLTGVAASAVVLAIAVLVAGEHIEHWVRRTISSLRPPEDGTR